MSESATMAKVVYHPHSWWRGLTRGLHEQRDAGIIRRNQGVRILVLLHLFYDEAWPEIKEYLLNLRSYGFDLIVTVTQGRISDTVIQDISALEGGERTIVEVPNKGFDLGPFFEATHYVKREYDIVFKLQAKGTKRPIQFIYHQLFFRRSWFINLYEGILSARKVHKVVDYLYHNDSIRIIAAKNLIIKDPPDKETRHRAMAHRLGLSLPKGYSYVAGTCFAMDGAYFKVLQQCGFDIDDFDNTVPTDTWDLAHFLERYICTIGIRPNQIAGTKVCRLHRLLCAPAYVVLPRLIPILKKLRR